MVVKVYKWFLVCFTVFVVTQMIIIMLPESCKKQENMIQSVLWCDDNLECVVLQEYKD